jgi:hypothetical protein
LGAKHDDAGRLLPGFLFALGSYPGKLTHRFCCRAVFSLGVVLFVIGLLYVNSNMIHTNPVLNIAGYHIFEIEDSKCKTTALICKRSYVRVGSELDAISVGDYVLLEKK